MTSTVVSVAGQMMKAFQQHQTECKSFIDPYLYLSEKTCLVETKEKALKRKRGNPDSDDSSGDDSEDEELGNREKNIGVNYPGEINHPSDEEEENDGREEDDEDEEEQEDMEDIYENYGTYNDKGESMEFILLVQLIILYNASDNKIEPFMKRLNYNAVLDALVDIETAFKARQSLQRASSETGELCGSTIAALKNNKEAVETAAGLPGFWKEIPDFERYVAIQPVESRVCKALLMLSCSKAYHWVTSIATAGVKSRTNPNTWVHQLARDVESAWRYRNSNPQHSKDAVFHSKDYLPSLASPCEARVVLKRWGMIEQEEQDNRTIQAVCSIIETWLQFPTSKDNKSCDKLRCALVTVITKHLPLSVLLLDATWSMFVRPYQTLILGQTGQRISRLHTSKVLKLFEEAISKHRMKNPASNEYLLLTVLTKQSENWFSLILNQSSEIQQNIPDNQVCLYL